MKKGITVLTVKEFNEFNNAFGELGTANKNKKYVAVVYVDGLFSHNVDTDDKDYAE